MYTYSSWGLCSPRIGEYRGTKVPGKSLAEDHDLVSGSKSKACSTSQRRNEKNKNISIVLKSIDQGHAYMRSRLVPRICGSLNVLTIVLFRGPI